MVEQEDHLTPSNRAVLPDEESALGFCIELWTDDRTDVERVLARAATEELARAIFAAAQSEFPGRRMTLRCGGDVMLDSSGS